MKEPRNLYNLRYYARKRGYLINRNTRLVCVPESGRSKKIEDRLKEFGYGIQLNLFSDGICGCSPSCKSGGGKSYQIISHTVTCYT